METRSKNSGKRRSLKTLQPLANNQLLLTRHLNTEAKQTRKSSANSSSKASQKSVPKSETIAKWLTDKNSIDNDADYWKLLAEERRVALEESLKQNEELATEMEFMKQEIKHWKQLANEGIELKRLIEQEIVERSQ